MKCERIVSSQRGMLAKSCSGSQVCQQLRNDYPKGLPVIMISNQADEASILRGLQVSTKSLHNPIRRSRPPFQASSSNACSHPASLHFNTVPETPTFNEKWPWTETTTDAKPAQVGSNDYIKKPFSRAEASAGGLAQSGCAHPYEEYSRLGGGAAGDESGRRL